MFWLSHHPPEEWNRTYVFFEGRGGVHVCARCLGTYPTLLSLFIAQAVLHVPLPPSGSWAQVVGVVALTVPALLDWVRGRFQPGGGTNAYRTLSGVLLGVALARSLYVHVHTPFPAMLRWQLGVVAAVALPTLFLASRQKQR